MYSIVCRIWYVIAWYVKWIISCSTTWYDMEYVLNLLSGTVCGLMRVPVLLVCCFDANSRGVDGLSSVLDRAFFLPVLFAFLRLSCVVTSGEEGSVYPEE